MCIRDSLTARPDADQTGEDARYANTGKNRADTIPARRTELTEGDLSPCATGPRPIGPRIILPRPLTFIGRQMRDRAPRRARWKLRRQLETTAGGYGSLWK